MEDAMLLLVATIISACLCGAALALQDGNMSER